MNVLQSLANVADFVSESGTWSYLLKPGKRSRASYRLCKALRALAPDIRTVFDVGANQGQFSGAVAHWFDEVQTVSFEPSSSVFQSLRQNTRHIKKIELVRSAVGNEAGTLAFYENRYSHASSALEVNSTLMAMRPETANVNMVMVPVTTLARFAAGRSWPRPLLLKLDVQGYERHVLEGAGAFLGEVDYLLFECSYRPLYKGESTFHDMYEYVRGLDFELLAPVGLLEDSNHVMVQADLLWKRSRAKTAKAVL